MRLFCTELTHAFVNGERLDTLLATRVREPVLGALVPAWLDWWGADDESQAESRYVRGRTRLQETPCELPILLCPDDYDLACTCVVVEVVASESCVRWRRFGLNTTEFSPERPLPRYIGGSGAWFPEPLDFVFDREEYVDCVRAVSGGRLP